MSADSTHVLYVVQADVVQVRLEHRCEMIRINKGGLNMPARVQLQVEGEPGRRIGRIACTHCLTRLYTPDPERERIIEARRKAWVAAQGTPFTDGFFTLDEPPGGGA